MLDLMSQVCDTVSSSAFRLGTGDSMADYKGFLTVMNWRITNVRIPISMDDGGDAPDNATLTMQLYQLALLLYLRRSSDGLIDQGIKTQILVERAFDILGRLSFCRQQFPIHVIGCEARKDEQRAAVLDIISRTEKMGSSRSFSYCKRILQAVWAHDDLGDGDNISYWYKMNSLISHCATTPIFT